MKSTLPSDLIVSPFLSRPTCLYRVTYQLGWERKNKAYFPIHEIGEQNLGARKDRSTVLSTFIAEKCLQSIRSVHYDRYDKVGNEGKKYPLGKNKLFSSIMWKGCEKSTGR